MEDDLYSFLKIIFMKFLLATLLIAVCSFIAGLFLPWWSIALVAFLVSLLINQSIGFGFISGFLGVFLLWALLAVWIDTKNDGILSHKIAQLFPLGGSSALLILVTAMVGGLVAGFAAMAGSSLRSTLIKRRYSV
jgi:hypothetical protein